MSTVVDALGPDGFGTYSVEWAAGQPVFTKVSLPPDHLLVPGFVDIHIHGAYGIDFMSATKDQMVDLCGELEKQGYEAFLPTTVTAPPQDVKSALENLPSHPLIAGFHLEGPFISDKHPGAQPSEHIVSPADGLEDWDEILDDDRLKVVTLAPETPSALDLTTRLTQNGVVVSMGHTDATFEQARRGFEFGAAHTTHTYNAMRGLHHREAGAVGYALINEALRCELIYDRLHVSPEAAELLFRCKPPGGVIAVSDSTMATAMEPGRRINMWGNECITEVGEVRLASNGALAGSAITLLDAFRNIFEDFGPERAIRACSLNPRDALRFTEPPKVYLEMDGNLDIIGRKVVQGAV